MPGLGFLMQIKYILLFGMPWLHVIMGISIGEVVRYTMIHHQGEHLGLPVHDDNISDAGALPNDGHKLSHLFRAAHQAAHLHQQAALLHVTTADAAHGQQVPSHR